MSRFDYFVVFAEMRTGSNFLEANINAFDGLHSYGEAFNPHFIGYPNTEEIEGVTQSQREADPASLVDAIKSADGLNGFRFFNDHDQRVLDIVLPDPRCAKIILTRNPVESYVSWKIASATGQWKLTDMKHARSRAVRFDGPEFDVHVEALRQFQITLLNSLQKSGQTAFYVAYEDLQDLDVMNGLAAFLGTDARLDGLNQKLKKQNPSPMSEKVVNFDEMQTALSRFDRFDLDRTPNFEPRRGPSVPTYVAAKGAPLLHMPIKSGPETAVTDWLGGVGAEPGLISEFTQKTLRQWKRKNANHRSFTVLRHPVARAHVAFCDRILSTGEGSYTEIRKTLRQKYNLEIPKHEDDDGYDRRAHRMAFAQFLQWLKGNLAGQSSIRVDAAWATQAQILQGMSQFALPDMVAREDRMVDDLAVLAAQVGLEEMPTPAAADPHQSRLAEIYDEEIEELVADVYQRDYMTFGFGAWA